MTFSHSLRFLDLAYKLYSLGIRDRKYHHFNSFLHKHFYKAARITIMMYYLSIHVHQSCWGPQAPKSVGSKVAKQAALGYVRRTLDRYYEFESTGTSCFAEPLYKEMLRSGSSQLNDTQLDAATSNESGKINGKSIERVSGTTYHLQFNLKSIHLFVHMLSLVYLIK